MSRKHQLSRRQLVMALSIPPIVTSGPAGAIASADAELIELGREFNEITAQIDAAINDPTKDLSYAALDRLERRHGRHTPNARHGHRGQANCTSVTLAKWLCRTADRVDPARVRGPFRRLGRVPSAPHSANLCSLLQ
jgi:hypothetical protein